MQTLDPAASRAALETLAAELGLESAEVAAEGVLTIADANMASAISSRTVQKGVDPRDYALVACGGAGPMQSCSIAAQLGVRTVIVPPHPGLTAATGLLRADVRYDTLRTEFMVFPAGAL